MFADPNDTDLQRVKERIAHFMHFQNMFCVDKSRYTCECLAENLPVLVPVAPRQLKRIMSTLEILD